MPNWLLGLRPSIREFYKWFRSEIVVALLSSDRGIFCDELIRARFTILLFKQLHRQSNSLFLFNIVDQIFQTMLVEKQLLQHFRT